MEDYIRTFFTYPWNIQIQNAPLHNLTFEEIKANNWDLGHDCMTKSGDCWCIRNISYILQKLGLRV